MDFTREVRVHALDWCPWARHFTFTVALSTLSSINDKVLWE